jgi:hypothetical protein
MAPTPAPATQAAKIDIRTTSVRSKTFLGRAACDISTTSVELTVVVVIPL